MDLGCVYFPGFGLAAVLYFFMVYRNTLSATRVLSFPGRSTGAGSSNSKPDISPGQSASPFSTGDIYFHQGKLAKAEASYRAALERDAEDVDTRAHLGQCCCVRNAPLKPGPCWKV